MNYRYLLFLIVFSFQLVAAVASDQVLDDRSPELLFEEIEEIEAYQDLVSEIQADQNLPINIATADLAELQTIPWISPLVATKIVKLRSKGGLDSLDDLRKIEELSPQVLDLIRPFVTFEKPKRSGSGLRFQSRVRFVGEVPVGDLSALGFDLRSQLRKGPLRLGLTIEKDKGEARLNDFQSGFLEVAKPRLKAVVGDYNLGLGCGLVFGAGYRLSPELIEVNKIRSRLPSLRPHTTVDENRYLRGLGLLGDVGGFHILAALSSNKIDARLDELGRIQSLPYSGTHTTRSQILARKSVRNDLGALGAALEQGKLKIMGAAAYSRFDHQFAQPSTYGARDSEIVGYGTAFSIDLEDLVLFGEVASNIHGHPAWLLGLVAAGKRAEMMFMARNYPRTYFFPNQRPFSFYDDISQGESGFFSSLRLDLANSVTMTFGSDLHKRAGINEQANSSGSQSFVRFKVDRGDISLMIDGKLTTSEKLFDDQKFKQSQRLRTRIDLCYRRKVGWDLKLRLERVEALTYTTSEKPSVGEVVRVVLGGNPRWGRIEGGFYVFDIDGYDSRIYQVEPGVPYYSTIAHLNGDGARWYIRLRLDGLGPNRLSLKLATMTSPGSESRRELLCYYGVTTD